MSAQARNNAGRQTPPRINLVVAKLGRLAAKHRVGQDRVADDDWQHEQRAHQNDHQTFGRAGRVVDRQPIGHDIGVRAVSHARKAKRHQNRGCGERNPHIGVPRRRKAA